MSTSGSRTAVAEQVGAKSQVTGLVGAVAIAAMLLLFPGLLRDLPQPTLAAVVIAASLSLADVPGTTRLWNQRRSEFALSIAAFLGVALLGVLPGIAVAVALSVINVFRRSWWPYQTQLGRVEGLQGYHDVSSYPQAELLPGLVVFRFDAPLFFANTRTFREQVLKLASTDPPPVWIVIAAEPITDVDTTAADMLEDLDEALNARGVSLVFAEMKDPCARRSSATSSPARSIPTTSIPPSNPRSPPTRNRRGPGGRADRRPPVRGRRSRALLPCVGRGACRAPQDEDSAVATNPQFGERPARDRARGARPVD